MKKILVVDNYDSFVFNVVQLVKESRFELEFDILHNDEVELSDLLNYDAILLSPGPGIPAEAGELLDVIRTAYRSLPILGICLGHQAIAQVFGATLQCMPSPLHGHQSVLKVVDDCDPLFQGIDHPLIVGRYHSWIVDSSTLPEELVITSQDEEGHIMSLRHRHFPVYGVQFHPESYMSNCGKELIDNWIKLFI